MGTFIRIILALILIFVIWQVFQAALGLVFMALIFIGICAVVTFIYKAMTYKEKN